MARPVVPSPPECERSVVSLPLDAPTTLALAVVVIGAFAAETAIGFGSTVIAVALSAFLAPIDAVLPPLVTLNVALSTYLVARYHREVDRRLLFTRVAPWMGLGLPLGALAGRVLGAAGMRLAFGSFVVVLSAIELRRGRARASEDPAPATSRIAGSALLVVAGIVHGAFATGGPLAVYVAGREIADKARFRATLAALWLLLNVALLGTYAAEGRLGGASSALAVVLAPALGAGILLGERIHRRVPATGFRTVVFALLLGAGLVLAARALPEVASHRAGV
jgi:hypothetical protein